jgi:hypothetical protein
VPRPPEGRSERIKLLAGAAELRSRAAQQLHLELVDHQLEQHRLGVAHPDDT